jgi:hypothetical protein
LSLAAAFERLARQNAFLRDLLITDPGRSVRSRTWAAVRELKLTRVSPALMARLSREAIGFNGIGLRMLNDTLKALKDARPKTTVARAEDEAKMIEDLKMTGRRSRDEGKRPRSENRCAQVKYHE